MHRSAPINYYTRAYYRFYYYFTATQYDIYIYPRLLPRASPRLASPGCFFSDLRQQQLQEAQDRLHSLKLFPHPT